MKLKKVIEEKVQRGHEPLLNISENFTVRQAAAFMCQHSIGAVLVADENEDGAGFVGIITERDVLKCCAEHVDLDKTHVIKVMTKDMVIATVDDDANDVISIMTQRHIRHIPIMEEKKVVALISVRDILHSLDQEKDITITHLGDYLGCTRLNQVF